MSRTFAHNTFLKSLTYILQFRLNPHSCSEALIWQKTCYKKLNLKDKILNFLSLSINLQSLFNMPNLKKKITPKSQIRLKTNGSKLGYINTLKLKEKYSNKKKIKSLFLAKQALYLFGFKVR